MEAQLDPLERLNRLRNSLYRTSSGAGLLGTPARPSQPAAASSPESVSYDARIKQLEKELSQEGAIDINNARIISFNGVPERLRATVWKVWSPALQVALPPVWPLWHHTRATLGPLISVACPLR
jgi:hypothetical protein